MLTINYHKSSWNSITPIEPKNNFSPHGACMPVGSGDDSGGGQEIHLHPLPCGVKPSTLRGKPSPIIRGRR